jgi:hypothetical protein
MPVTALFVLAFASLISTMPLPIAVMAAVLGRDPRRRADARRVVRMLRPAPTSPPTTRQTPCRGTEPE